MTPEALLANAQELQDRKGLPRISEQEWARGYIERAKECDQLRGWLKEVHDEKAALSVKLEEQQQAHRDELMDVQGQLEAVEQERDKAMAVLAPNMPESGLVDACKQVKQVAISEADNSEKFEAKLHEVEAERDAARSSRDGLSESLHNAMMLMQASLGEVVKTTPASAEDFGLAPEMQPIVDELRLRMKVEAARGEVVKPLSGQPCGCDPAENWTCERHATMPVEHQ